MAYTTNIELNLCSAYHDRNANNRMLTVYTYAMGWLSHGNIT